jgi:hypothetical protein
MNYHFNYVDRFYLDDSADRRSFFYFSRSNYIGRSHFVELYDNLKWEQVSLLAGIDYRFNNTSQDYYAFSMLVPTLQNWKTLQKCGS